jgi:hypothetical protein
MYLIVMTVMYRRVKGILFMGTLNCLDYVVLIIREIKCQCA